MTKLLLLLALALHTSLAHKETGQTFLTGGGCATIPGCGSPILMIANAHKFIEDNLKIQNTYSNVRYIHYVKTPSPGGEMMTNYKLVFSLTDYVGTKYIAIDMDQSPFGIGSTKINRFLMTPDPARIRQYIDINFNNKTSYSCGDMKFVYSSFGNDPTTKMEYLYPGRNQNSAGLAVLNNLSSNPADEANNEKKKTCATSNFLSTTNFYGTPTASTPVDLISCHPTKQSCSMILISCINNAISSLQLAFNNIGDNGTNMSQFCGNPSTPASAIVQIDLKNAFKLQCTSATSPPTMTIKTFDKHDKMLQQFTCGTGTTAPKTHMIYTADFLGCTDVHSSATGVEACDIATYSAA